MIDKLAIAKGYIPVAMTTVEKAEADAEASGMTLTEWVSYLILDYSPPQDGPVVDDD